MKKTTGCVIVMGIPVLIIIVLFILIFMPRTYHIKTEYGDHFTVRYDPLIDDGDDEYSFVDENSDFFFLFQAYNGKKDLHAICDTPYFRAYRLKNDMNDVYIIKIKETDAFDYIWNSEDGRAYMYEQFQEKFGDRIKSNLLCDEHLIEIAGPYLYHTDINEMRTVADDLNHGNYGKLKEYGLTDEMIQDKESMEKKKVLMNQLVQGWLIY